MGSSREQNSNFGQGMLFSSSQHKSCPAKVKESLTRKKEVASLSLRPCLLFDSKVLSPYQYSKVLRFDIEPAFDLTILTHDNLSGHVRFVATVSNGNLFDLLQKLFSVSLSLFFFSTDICVCIYIYEYDQNTQLVQSRLVIPECGPLADR